MKGETCLHTHCFVYLSSIFNFQLFPPAERPYGDNKVGGNLMTTRPFFVFLYLRYFVIISRQDVHTCTQQRSGGNFQQPESKKKKKAVNGRRRRGEGPRHRPADHIPASGKGNSSSRTIYRVKLPSLVIHTRRNLLSQIIHEKFSRKPPPQLISVSVLPLFGDCTRPTTT